VTVEEVMLRCVCRGLTAGSLDDAGSFEALGEPSGVHQFAVKIMGSANPLVAAGLERGDLNALRAARRDAISVKQPEEHVSLLGVSGLAKPIVGPSKFWHRGLDGRRWEEIGQIRSLENEMTRFQHWIEHSDLAVIKSNGDGGRFGLRRSHRGGRSGIRYLELISWNVVAIRIMPHAEDLVTLPGEGKSDLVDGGNRWGGAGGRSEDGTIFG